MKYGLMQNIKYVYKASFEHSPRLKYLLLLDFIAELFVPFSATLITTIAVYILSNNIGVTPYVITIVGISILMFLMQGLRNWAYITYTFENIFTRNSTFMIRLSEHQLTTDYENVEPKHKRDIISKAFESISSNMFGVELMMRNAPEAFYNLVGMLIYGVLVTIYSPMVLVILIVMTIVNYYLTGKANRYLQERREEIGKLFDEKYYLSQDVTNHINGKDVRVYQMKNWFETIFKELTKQRVAINRKVESRFLFANVSDTLFLMIRDLFAYSTLLVLVINGSITLTHFTFLTGIVTGFTLWLNGFVANANNLRSSNIATNDYRTCIETESRTHIEQTRSVDSLEKPLRIEFRNVSFTYPGSEDPVLQDVSFVIKPGEKIALVGNNGAGKTTLVKLLCGLYRPTSGSILVNDIDISSFRMEDYMTLLSVVFQDSEPLAFTIAQNIAGTMKEEIDYQRVYDSLEKAGLKEKIESLPQTIHSFISQEFNKEGIKLSGGETQKLMLARALYKNAAFLILDEPTAALDPISEEQMYLRYEEFLKGNTSLFISHRLSSTKFCDTIFFLQDGVIIEQGSHYELMSRDTEYKELFSIQAKYYQEDKTNEIH